MKKAIIEQVGEDNFKITFPVTKNEISLSFNEKAHIDMELGPNTDVEINLVSEGTLQKILQQIVAFFGMHGRIEILSKGVK